MLILLLGTLLSAACGVAVDPASISDAQTAARIKTALVNDADVGEFSIEVRVVRGVATLSGVVLSPALAARAVAIARAVPGVSGVESRLEVDSSGAAPPSTADARPAERPEIDPGPDLLAIGASFGLSGPRHEALKHRTSISPLFKLGAPQGLGPAIAFDWFHASLESVGLETSLARVNVKPIMLGLAYTAVVDRLSFSPSIVGGFAFNSLTITDTGTPEGLPVEVHNSFAWRIGASAWYNVSRRVAFNTSVGYLMTGLRLTVLENGQLQRRRTSGDTTLLHVGLAYRLF